MPNDKKIELLRMLNTLDPERLTKEDFVKAFETAIELFKRLEKQNIKEIKQLTERFNDVSKQLKDGNSLDLSDIRKEVSIALDKALKDQSVGMNLIRDKVRELKSGDDGLDADENVIVDRVLAQIKLPEQKEILLDSPEELKIKITPMVEELLKELKDDLEEKISSIPRGGKIITGRYVNTPMVDDFSGDTNGSKKTFTLSKAPKTITTMKVWGSDFPTILRPTTDFTISGKTLTLTDEIDSPTSGATLITEYYV